MGFAAAVAMAAPAAASAATKPLTFETAFSTKGEPPALHYQAAFVANGGEHRLEVWRDGDRRIKRATDAGLITYTTHRPGDPDFHMAVLDTRKRINTQVNRTSLYRIGNFTDWFDLGHGLRHPKGVYKLAAAMPPPGAPAPCAACRWYDLARASGITHICWSSGNRLPLLIVAGGKPVWRVTAIDTRPIAPATFVVADRGYVRIDASQDIDHD